jgi:hypothetical protein
VKRFGWNADAIVVAISFMRLFTSRVSN